MRSLLAKLPIGLDETLEISKVDMTRDASLPASVAATLSQIGDATKMVDRATKTAAYMAYLGQPGGMSRDQIAGLNQWTRYGWGWESPPAIAPKLAQRLGIGRYPGVVLQDRNTPRFDDSFEDELNGVARPRTDRLDKNRGGFGGRGGGGFGSGGRDRSFGSSGGDRGFGGSGGGRSERSSW